MRSFTARGGSTYRKEVTDAFDDLHPGVLGDVALGVGDEREVDAAVAVPVEVKRRLRRGPEQRGVLGGVSVGRLVLISPGSSAR